MTFQSMKYGGHLDSLSVKAATKGTMFNLLLKDANGVTQYKKENITTEWIDNKLHLPVRDIWTIAIENCDPDDTITLTAGFTEAKSG